MLLNEIINEVGMTKRAVKYYEEKGLLSVDKDSNGYRNYSVQDVETLKKISVYSVCLLSRYLQLTTLTSAPVMPESEQIQKSAKYSPLNPEQIHHEYG